jgi:hypothetical protein
MKQKRQQGRIWLFSFSRFCNLIIYTGLSREEQQQAAGFYKTLYNPALFN